MDNALNPFTPNAGAMPEALIGREEQTAAFETLLRRLEKGRTDQSMIVTGLRGVGKTVLLNRFRNTALSRDWLVIEIEASKSDESAFRKDLFAKIRGALLSISPRAKWDEALRKAGGALSSFSLNANMEGNISVSWDVPALEGVADHGELSLDFTDLLMAVGEVLKQRGRGLVLLVDEVQFLNQKQLEAIIQAIHRTVQRALPITFVGAGLPQIAELAGDAKSYAERLFKFPEIGSLNQEQAREAFVSPARDEGVEFEPDAIDFAYEITEGYPYFIQELGYHAWSVATSSPITKSDVVDSLESYEAKLDGSFFRVRLDRATPLQTAYLRAMAENGDKPQRAQVVGQLLGRDSSELGPTRAELISMGLLYTPEHGYAAFTVPKFSGFLKRAIPELVIPEKRVRRGQAQ